MTVQEFWSSTPREFAAHLNLINKEREFIAWRTADILAAMHNTGLVLKKGQHFTAAMFMPGYKPPPAELPKWDANRDFERFKDQFDPVKKRATVDQSREIGIRMTRASQAQREGATKDQIESILRGTL